MIGLFGYDPPEEEDDNICPECGAEWAKGENCNDGCEVNEAYGVEREEEN